MKRSILLIPILFLVACGMPLLPDYNAPSKYTKKSSPNEAIVQNAFFEARVSPVPGYYCFNSFMLTLKNATKSDLEIIWDKTLYIRDNQTEGGFLFGTDTRRDALLIRPHDIVFPGAVFSKELFPAVVVNSSRYGEWSTNIHPGRAGVYLTVKVGDRIIKENLTTVLHCYK